MGYLRCEVLGEAKIFLIPRETNILHLAIDIEATDSGMFYPADYTVTGHPSTDNIILI